MDQLREIDEAVRAADDALAYLRRAARSLGSARNYGVWDILGGGFLATMLKHSKLDKARVEMENARDAMRRFSDELGLSYQMLCAHRLEFTHPLTDETMILESHMDVSV